MTIATGGHAKGATTFSVPASTVTSATTTTTGGAGTVFHTAFLWYNSTTQTSPTTIRDSKSNVYTIVQSIVSAAGDNKFRFALYRSLGTNGGPAGAPTVGGTLHTASVDFAGNQDAITVWFHETTGGASSIVDVSPAGAEDTTSPYSSPNAVTTNANDLLICFAATGNAGGTEVLDWSASSFVSIGDNVGDSNNNLTGDVATRLVSATGTYAASFTASGAGTNDSMSFIVALKDAAVAAVSDDPRSAARRQLERNAVYRTSPRSEDEARCYLRKQKRAYGFAATL